MHAGSIVISLSALSAQQKIMFILKSYLSWYYLVWPSRQNVCKNYEVIPDKFFKLAIFHSNVLSRGGPSLALWS